MSEEKRKTTLLDRLKNGSQHLYFILSPEEQKALDEAFEMDMQNLEKIQNAESTRENQA